MERLKSLMLRGPNINQMAMKKSNLIRLITVENSANIIVQVGWSQDPGPT